MRMNVVLVMLAGLTGPAYAADGEIRALPPSEAVTLTALQDLDDLAARMRRLQLAAFGLDAVQANVQARLQDLDSERDAVGRDVAQLSRRVRQARAGVARNLGLYVAADLSGTDIRRRAIRRAMLSTQRLDWARTELRLQDAKMAWAQVDGEIVNADALLEELDREAAAVALQRDQVDDAPIAALWVAQAEARIASNLAQTQATRERRYLPKDEPPLLLGLDEDLVWPATAPTGADNDQAGGINIEAPAADMLRSWSNLLSSTRMVGNSSAMHMSSDHGITLDIASGERITAPAGGTIMFAGEFRTYGLILIIDHGDGYHTLMAGFSHLNIGLGAVVRPGDVVGSLDVASGSAGQLYVEVRHQGVPVDPMPWLTAREDKVRG
jgi:murein DD-endopeptidase MepM/ murein hydrolase activator NlpD